MKRVLLALILCGLTSPALADSTKVDPSANTTRLPGNAYIVTNDDDGPNGIVIRDDRSIWYRAIVAPHTGVRDFYAPQRAPMGFVDGACGGITNINDKNKCIGEAIKEQEKLRKRYN